MQSHYLCDEAWDHGSFSDPSSSVVDVAITTRNGDLQHYVLDVWSASVKFFAELRDIKRIPVQLPRLPKLNSMDGQLQVRAYIVRRVRVAFGDFSWIIIQSRPCSG